MLETERDLLIKINTKLDMFIQDLDKHITEDDKHFNEIFSRLRNIDKERNWIIGGFFVSQGIVITLATAIKFWH
jgi:hypothetical protein